MPRTRVIQAAPTQVITTAMGVIRPVAPAAIANPLTAAAAVPVDDRPFQPEASALDDAWAKEVERRERAEGIERKAMKTASEASGREAPTLTATEAAIDWQVRHTNAPSQSLTSLPDRFALEIERKPDGWWKITAPSVHVGIFVANKDLRAALADAPDSMAKILQLDGPMPQQRKRKRRDA